MDVEIKTHFLTMDKSKLFKESIADAKALKEAAIANAKKRLMESMDEETRDLFAKRITEAEDMEDLDEELEFDLTEESSCEKDEMSEGEDEFSIDEIIQEIESEEEAEGETLEEEEEVTEAKGEKKEDEKEEKEDDKDEEAEESKEDEEDEVDLSKWSEEDMKAFIIDVITDFEKQPHEEAPSEEGEEDFEFSLDGEGDEASVSAEEEILSEALNRRIQKEKDAAKLVTAQSKYASMVLRNPRITSEAKSNAIDLIDSTKTIAEAKLVYDTILKTAINERKEAVKKPVARASKATTPVKPQFKQQTGTPMLSESTVKRFQTLAGIIKEN